jgi:hypothetical protein
MDGSHTGFAGFPLTLPGVRMGCVQANIFFRQIHRLMIRPKMQFDPGGVPEFFLPYDIPKFD